MCPQQESAPAEKQQTHRKLPAQLDVTVTCYCCKFLFATRFFPVSLNLREIQHNHTPNDAKEAVLVLQNTSQSRVSKKAHQKARKHTQQISNSHTITPCIIITHPRANICDMDVSEANICETVEAQEGCSSKVKDSLGIKSRKQLRTTCCMRPMGGSQ
jgi:hypothetical protein